jgi:hypothetical protein
MNLLFQITFMNYLEACSINNAKKITIIKISIYKIRVLVKILITVAALGGLVVSVLATGPTGHSVAGSNPTSFGGEVKPSVPCRRFTACKRTLHSMSEMLCRPNFLTCFSPVIFSCFATRWLWLLNQADTKTSDVAPG